MRLQQTSLANLHFPRNQWQWLRKSISINSVSPDFFLWAAQVDGKLWAWHPQGAEVELSQPETEMPLLVLDSDGTELSAFGLYLKTTFTASPPIDAEWVSALQVLTQRLQYKMDTELPPFWADALKAAHLEPHLGVLAQRARFLFLTKEELQLLFDRRWDPSVLELLETWPAKQRELFVGALTKWSLTASQVKEASHHTMILARKLGEKSVERVLSGSYGNTEEFRMALLRTAQPELATLSQNRLEKLRGLKLPPRTSVYGDPSFENDVLKITHTPRTLADFQLFKNWVDSPEISDKIKALLEIYQ